MVVQSVTYQNEINGSDIVPELWYLSNEKGIYGCIFRITPFVKFPFGKSFVGRIPKIEAVKGQENHSSYVKKKCTCFWGFFFVFLVVFLVCLLFLLGFFFVTMGYYYLFSVIFGLRNMSLNIFRYWVSFEKIPVVEKCRGIISSADEIVSVLITGPWSWRCDESSPVSTFFLWYWTYHPHWWRKDERNFLSRL